MKKIKILLLFLLSLSLIGCSGKHVDINQLVLVSAIGFDKTDEGFKLIAQVVNKNILSPNPPQITPVFIVTSEGETVLDCLTDLNDLLPNRAFMINLQLLLFSEEVAKEGIAEYMHFFVNFTEAQHEYNVLITKDVTAEELLSQISVFSIFPTRVLINKLKSANEQYGFARLTYVEEVVNSIRDNSQNLVLSSVSVNGDLKGGTNIDQNKDTKITSKIFISNLGVFKDGKLKGWLTKEESIAYNFIKDEIKKTIIVVEGTKNNKISSLVREVKTSTKVSIDNGIPKVKVEIKFDALIAEDTSLVINLDKEYEADVKNKLEEKIKTNIDDLLLKSKNEIRFDIFNFSNEFYKHEPKWWDQNKINYEQIFQSLDIEVKVTGNIERMDI